MADKVYRKLEKIGSGKFNIWKIVPNSPKLCGFNDDIIVYLFPLDQCTGSYGTVYKGKDMETGRIVAMKRIHVDLSANGFPQSYLRYAVYIK